MSFNDKTLTCRDCGTEFTFTAGEQEFYAQKGFDNEPTRCQNCRRQRKQQSQGGGSYSSDRSYGGGGSYSSGGGSYSSGSGGGYSSGGGYGQRERVQHETTCSQCGRTTTVPFVPRGDRPVYCNDCFAQQRGGSSRGGSSRGGSGGGYNNRY